MPTDDLMPMMPPDIHYIQAILSEAFHPICPACKHPFQNSRAKLNWVMPTSSGWLAIIEDRETGQSYTIVIKPIKSTVKAGKKLMFSDFEKLWRDDL